MNDLANTYRDQGSWKEAQSLQEVALEKHKQLLGDDHPDTFNSMNNLAITYSGQGLWKQAQSLQEIALEKRKKILGQEHPLTLQNINDLTNNIQATGTIQASRGTPKQRTPSIIIYFIFTFRLLAYFPAHFLKHCKLFQSLILTQNSFCLQVDVQVVCSVYQSTI